jgi:hypothetical protein
MEISRLQILPIDPPNPLKKGEPSRIFLKSPFFKGLAPAASKKRGINREILEQESLICDLLKFTEVKFTEALNERWLSL